MIHASLALKFVVAMAMISQVNHYAPRLHLPVEVPINEQDIRFLIVVPPDQARPMGARLVVKNYSFRFTEKSFSLVNQAEDGLESFGIPILKRGESSITVLDRAARMKFILSTNDTYRLATNYLEEADIDLVKLEKVNPFINKYPMYNSDRGWVPNPVLIAMWHSTNSPGNDTTEVVVTISTVSGELLQLTQEGFFSKIEQPLVKDLDKLTAISDGEFLKYSSLERSNLVVRFAGVHCPAMRIPGIEDVPSPETNSFSNGLTR